MAVVYNYNAGPTYTKIANITLSSDQNDITFSNIPQNYTDLVFVVQAQSNATGSSTNGMRCRINSDSGTNYSYTTIQGNGTSASSYRETSVDYFIPGEIPQTSATSRSLCTFSVMNYANTTTFKTIISRGDSHTVASAAVGLWRSTAAVTSVSISRNFFVDSTSKVKSGSSVTLYGITAALKPKATGGNTVTTDGTYWYHTFTSSGVFTPTQSINADYLVVAGGGGGGGWQGGGGGAGGLRSTVTATGGGGTLETALSLSLNTSYTVTVGAGGAGTSYVPTSDNAASGSNSVFSTITSTGGGKGGGYSITGAAAATGGSGGGGTDPSSPGSAGAAGTANQGYGGGNAVTSNPYNAGGGGGAGAAGGNASTSNGGAGGNGVAVAISGSSVTYAGGGGGGTAGNNNSSRTGGTGGTGGGGAGGNSTGTGSNASGTGSAGTNGTTNLGGGGGGAGYGTNTGNTFGGAGGNGGSGIVIVRYSA